MQHRWFYMLVLNSCLPQHSIALETEEQGADILRNLRLQREQIENSRNTVRAALTKMHLV
jgi:hypothetical protein